MQAGQLILVDTNIIIEAVRTKCWNAVANHFALETVGKCHEEALTGDALRPGYVQVDVQQLTNGLRQVHPVTDLSRAKLYVAYPEAQSLDAGERDLFAHALERGDAWIASCADRAAVKTACALGWKDRLVSLEKIAAAAGQRPSFKNHFTEPWLTTVRTKFLLDGGLS